VTALVGDNGRKSTLVKIIGGTHPIRLGTYEFDGQPAMYAPTDASVGIEIVYQDLALADNLDVVQNMFLGRERSRRRLDEHRWNLRQEGARPLKCARSPVGNGLSLSGGTADRAIAKSVLWKQAVISREPTARVWVWRRRAVSAWCGWPSRAWRWC